MVVRFTQASRKHRLGRARILHVMATAEVLRPVRTTGGFTATYYLGRDPRGFAIEVIAVESADGDLLVIHARPIYPR